MPNTEARKDAIKRLAFKKVVSDTYSTVKHLEMEAESFAVKDADSTQYGEQKIRSVAQEGVATAGNVTLEAARSACIKFKTSHEVLVAQENKIPQEIPEGSTCVDITDDAQRQNVLKNMTAEKRVVENRHNATTVSGNKEGHMDGLLGTQRRKAEAQQAAVREKKLKQHRQQSLRKNAVQKHLREHEPYKARYARFLNSNGKQAASKSVRQCIQEVWQKIKALAAEIAEKLSGASLCILVGVLVVILLVLITGAVAAVVGSPMGILLADEANDPNSIPILVIVQEINTEFEEELERIIASHPECDGVNIHYLYPEGQTWKDFWPEILALYAVDANMNRGEDVAVLDADSKNRIREIFWQMHSIDVVVETVEIPTIIDPDEENVEDSETDDFEDLTEKQSPMYNSVLSISIYSKTVDQMCMELGFEGEQIDIMHQLLVNSIRQNLLALCTD